MTAAATKLSAVFREFMAGARTSGMNSSVSKYDSRRISEALAADLISAGVDPACIRVEQRASESARYRLSPHLWDLILVSHGIPVVVIEWKTLNSSFRNTYNNRLDELVAAAISLRSSFAQADATAYWPHLAFLFIADPPQQPAGHDYLDRFADPLRSLVSDGRVDCACILRFDPDSRHLTDFSEDLAWGQFAASVVSATRTPRGERAEAGDLSAEVGRLFAHGNARGFASGFASTAAGQSAVEATIIENRREKIKELQGLAVAEGTTELQMQTAIGRNYWIFGGQYVDLAPVIS